MLPGTWWMLATVRNSPVTTVALVLVLVLVLV